MLFYKNFIATYCYCSDCNGYHGVVLEVSEVVEFYGKDFFELQRNFKIIVDKFTKKHSIIKDESK